LDREKNSGENTMQTACLRIPCASISTSTIRFVRLNRFPYYNIHKPVTNPDCSDPEYFDREAQKNEFGPGYLDKLKELWDEREATQRDVSMKRQDMIIEHDGKYWLPDVDPTTPRLGFEKVEALKKAPESVKKIFSVAYGDRENLTEIWKHRIMNKVRENELETNSLEAQIAYKTAVIRHMSEAAFSQIPNPPKWWRQMIHDLIGKRKAELEKLRQQNQASFERVLEKLRIAYQSPPLPEEVPLQTRKGWVEHQTKVKAEAMKEQKLRDYHDLLKRQQPAFEKLKTDRLSALAKEESELRRDLDSMRTNEGEILNVVGEYKGHTIGEVFENKAHAYFYMPGAVRAAENKNV